VTSISNLTPKAVIPSNRFAEVITVIFFSALIILPQSYFELRLALLVLFLVVHAVLLTLRGRLVITTVDFLFYVGIACSGVFWAAIGTFNGGDVDGVLSGLKLYVAWSAVYLVVISFYRNCYRLELLHTVFVVATLGIVAINLAAMADAFFQTGLASPTMIEELGLGVAFLDGYVRFNSHNIASLFFLMGYLTAYKLCAPHGQSNRALDNLALILGLLVTVLAGRRALWLVIILVPAVCLGVALVSRSARRISKGGKRFLFVYVALAATIGPVYLFVTDIQQPAALEYVQSAFSAEDERTIQKDYLIEGFIDYPVIGSGFGAYAGYTRNVERPWVYELTYHQMLFNVGVVGVSLLLLGFLFFLHLALAGLRDAREDFAVRLGILAGFLAISIGSYSNPYLQFFDSLIFVMFFALLCGSTLAKPAWAVRVAGRS
jgi:hypothetical protein